MIAELEESNIQRSIELELQVLMMVIITCRLYQNTEKHLIVQNRILLSQVVKAEVCTVAGEIGLIFSDYKIHHLETCELLHHVCLPNLIHLELRQTASPPYPWADRLVDLAKQVIISNQSNTLNVDLLPRCPVNCIRCITDEEPHDTETLEN